MAFAQVDISGGQVSTVDSVSSATASVVNWVTDPAGINRMRPALTEYTTTGLGSSTLIGLFRWQTYIIGVTADRKIYAISDGAPTAWVALSDSTTATKLDGALRPVFAEDPDDVFIAGGGAIQKWSGVGLTARLGGGSPNATHIMNLGERMVANNMTAPSEFDYSSAGDELDNVWPGNFQTADARPDPIRAIYENTAEASIFGASTLEVYGISPDPVAPFQRVITMNLGCSAPYSPVRFDNMFVWLDDKRRFVQSDGRQYSVLSDAIQKDLRDLTTVSDCFGYREDTDLFNCLVWVFPTAGRTFAYDYSGKRWHERKFYATPFQSAWPVTCHAYWDAQNLNIVGASSAAKLFKLDTTARLDDGGPMVAERITGWQDFGTTDMKRSATTEIVLRRGSTALGATDGRLEIAVSNDGRAFTPFKTITIGQPGDTEMSMFVFFGGVFRRRKYWLRYSGSDDIAIAGLYDDVVSVEDERQQGA